MALNGNWSCGFGFVSAIILRLKYVNCNWVGVVSRIRWWRGDGIRIKLNDNLNWKIIKSPQLHCHKIKTHNSLWSFHHKLMLPFSIETTFLHLGRSRNHEKKKKQKKNRDDSLFIFDLDRKMTLYRILTGLNKSVYLRKLRFLEVFKFIEIFLSLTFYLLDREHTL